MSIASREIPLRARTCQSHRPFLAFCHTFLLQGVGPLYMRKWLGTTVTHFWRLTRLRRRPPRRVEEAPIHAWKRRAKIRARISATVKSILRNNGVRVWAFTRSVAIKYAKSCTVSPIETRSKHWHPRITFICASRVKYLSPMSKTKYKINNYSKF